MSESSGFQWLTLFQAAVLLHIGGLGVDGLKVDSAPIKLTIISHNEFIENLTNGRYELPITHDIIVLNLHLELRHSQPCVEFGGFPWFAY